MATVEVVSATSALPEETKLEQPIKAEETTPEEVATLPPVVEPPAEEGKETETAAAPEELPVAPEPEAPVADVETEVVAEELVAKKESEESSPKVAPEPEPVEEESKETEDSTEAPMVGPELVTEAPEEEVGGGEEKPAQTEEEVGAV
ncbi:hypothetical protein Acr_00g0030030 [Actinidia rufa]|uniref:Uncharacterized protein n=1 Tax=Actinidia rufa TaxID=165716 RepID=A0A7J0DGK0_9ERIC|nr:hypothetical protein Acr_00g0030030 [Actinidia rufa]